jgi:exosome complex component RRP46
VSSDGDSRTILQNPNISQFQSAESVHVLAFTSHGELIVAESEGSFTLEEWDEVHDVGKRLCWTGPEQESDSMHEGLDEKDGSVMRFARSVLEQKVENDLKWKS